MTERDMPTHYQTILMSSQMEKLKELTGEDSTLHALSVAVSYTLQNMKSKKETKP
jgi:hypothetical protein